MNELIRCLRKWRRDNHLSQQAFADQAGISKSELISLESGIFVLLSEEALNGIAAALHMNPGMMNIMYYSVYQNELKKASETIRTAKPVHTIEPSTQETPDMDEVTLANLEKDILALPVEKRSAVITGIQTLLQVFNEKAA